MILIIFCILAMCLFTSCKNEIKNENMYKDELSNVDHPLLSPCGNYEAIIEKFDNNGVRSYKLYIEEVKDKYSYEADLIFRAIDRNYVFWADEEDVLWEYSGDVGIFFWVKEDSSWMKKSYADNPKAIAPQALQDALPKLAKWIGKT
ncbi:MAG: hypothetical protein FWH57_06870 [Oscillospiraceae bacterium]|nr:hypothetical protein [Oscillospiraceae bacterium]